MRRLVNCHDFVATDQGYLGVGKVGSDRYRSHTVRSEERNTRASATRLDIDDVSGKR
jgi:hypothetical protein